MYSSDKSLLSIRSGEAGSSLKNGTGRAVRKRKCLRCRSCSEPSCCLKRKVRLSVPSQQHDKRTGPSSGMQQRFEQELTRVTSRRATLAVYHCPAHATSGVAADWLQHIRSLPFPLCMDCANRNRAHCMPLTFGGQWFVGSGEFVPGVSGRGGLYGLWLSGRAAPDAFMLGRPVILYDISGVL